MKISLLLLSLTVCVGLCAQTPAESRSWQSVAQKSDKSWYASPQAKEIADNVLFFQHSSGGWPKNILMHKPITKQLREQVKSGSNEMLPTIDNNATSIEMDFMANMYNATKEPRYKASFLKGLQYIFDAQYPNGGWPQFYPPIKKDYSTHITYNDNAMVNVMILEDKIAGGDALYADLVTPELRAQAAKSFDKGVDCIVATQIVVDGVPTVWCQQHDEVTLAPAHARAYELPSYTAGETCGILMLLMNIENPSAKIINAVNGGVKWLDAHKIEGIRIDYEIDADGKKNRVVVADAAAAPIWARYYDLQSEKPFFCDRDGVKRENLSDIGHERRNGYAWYITSPVAVLKAYDKWKLKWNK